MIDAPQQPVPVVRRANPALTAVVRKSATLTVILGAIVAVVGGAIGWFVGAPDRSVDGLLSALVGAGLAVVFAVITALSLWLGSRFGGVSFLGIVMGGWLVKIVVFMGLLALVAQASFVVKPVLFGSIVAAILGSLAADTYAAMRTRVPYVDDDSAHE